MIVVFGLLHLFFKFVEGWDYNREYMSYFKNNTKDADSISLLLSRYYKRRNLNMNMKSQMLMILHAFSM